MKITVRTLRLIALSAALISVVVFPPWSGLFAWLLPLPDTVQEQVEQAVDRGLDGIIVYVDQAGRPPAVYQAGWKNRELKRPADPDALFKIASISKLYLAVAAAKLAAGQRLSLDSTLSHYLPELSAGIENAGKITVRELLQHRSGIPNYSDHDEFDWSNPPANTGESLLLIKGQPALFRPGENYQYSNTNYLLLGEILDRVLAYDHRRFIREQILQPLNLRNTHGLLRDVSLEDVSSGYHHGYEADFKAVETVSPSGAMVATAQDVGIFLRALNDGSLLSHEEQAIYSSVYQYGHTGWLLGYQSIARYHEEIDAVVIQLVNSTGGDSELIARVVYNRIIRILNWKTTIVS